MNKVNAERVINDGGNRIALRFPIDQELPGHQSIKTTEIYTHVTAKDIQNIRSPLDDL
jgi:hypothetical protein